MPEKFRYQIKSSHKHDPYKRELRRIGTHCGWKWSHFRRLHLMRYPLCSVCNLLGEHVHHIQSRADRPDLMYERSNLQTLCLACHARAHMQSYPQVIHNPNGGGNFGNAT